MSIPVRPFREVLEGYSSVISPWSEKRSRFENSGRRHIVGCLAALEAHLERASIGGESRRSQLAGEALRKLREREDVNGRHGLRSPAENASLERELRRLSTELVPILSDLHELV